MSPPNLIIWSISRKESPEFQQKLAFRNWFLRTLLSQHPFLTEFVFITKNCFIQYNAALQENVNVAQEVSALSKKLFVFSQL